MLTQYHVSKNLFDEDNATFGYWTNSSGQTVVGVYGAQYRIDLTNISTLTAKAHGVAPYSLGFCWYQSDDTFISRDHFATETTEAKTVTVPNNADYVVFQASCPTQTRLTPQMLASFEIMLNEGQTALPYESYGNTWNEIPYRIINTSQDTITSLPAEVIADGDNATAWSIYLNKLNI